jgi:hypothetical protein
METVFVWNIVLISHENCFTTSFVKDLRTNEEFIYLFLRCGHSAFSTKTTKDSVEEQLWVPIKCCASFMAAPFFVCLHAIPEFLLLASGKYLVFSVSIWFLLGCPSIFLTNPGFGVFWLKKSGFWS